MSFKRFCEHKNRAEKPEEVTCLEIMGQISRKIERVPKW